MSQEGAAKLRLKPRKAPPACSREPSPGRESPRRRWTSSDSCSWFEKEDLNECEKTWILLLKNISQDLQCTNWQTVPSFPEFFGKFSLLGICNMLSLGFMYRLSCISLKTLCVCVSQSSEEECLQKQDVFTIGMKDFQWVSFPSFSKGKCLEPKDLSSHQLTQSHIDRLHQGWGQADELKSLPSTAEKTCRGTITDQIKNTVGEDRKGISKLDLSPKSCELTQHRSSAHPLVLSQSSAEAFTFQQHCRGRVQNSRENRKGDDGQQLQIQTHQGNISFGEARYVPTEEKPPLASTPGTESCKEKTENQDSTLDSCPMCLIRFSGTLSQLDIDGHLARCLSESADDVTW